jgi:hypothetical protein
LRFGVTDLQVMVAETRVKPPPVIGPIEAPFQHSGHQLVLAAIQQVHHPDPDLVQVIR